MAAHWPMSTKALSARVEGLNARVERPFDMDLPSSRAVRALDLRHPCCRLRYSLTLEEPSYEGRKKTPAAGRADRFGDSPGARLQFTAGWHRPAGRRRCHPAGPDRADRPGVE